MTNIGGLFLSEDISSFHLPIGWNIDLLDHLAKRGSGHTPDKQFPEYWNGGIKWVSLADSNKLDRIYIYDTDKEISELGIQNSSATKHPAGTVVLSRDAGVGKSAILGSQMAVSQHFMAWVCGPRLDNHYLYYWLQYMKPEFERMAVGSTIKTIGLGYFQKLKIVYPPLAEQRKIAAILGTWDEAIAKVEQLIAALQKRKQGLMQRLLTGEVRFPEFAGSEWKKVELSECLYPISRDEQVQPDREYKLIGVKWYLQGAHIHNTVKGEEFVTQSLSRVAEGDILYNKMWVSKAAFAIAKKEHDGTYGSGEYPQFQATDKLNVQFLEYAYHTPRFLHDATALCRGTTGRIRLNPSDFLKLKISIPSIKEQTKIANCFQTLTQEIKNTQNYLETLILQKKALMEQLLTGHIRVSNDEDERHELYAYGRGIYCKNQAYS